MHICPYRAMAIFILNKISLLEPKTQNCVRSAYQFRNFSTPLYVPCRRTDCLSALSSPRKLLPSASSLTNRRGTQPMGAAIAMCARRGTITNHQGKSIIGIITGISTIMTSQTKAPHPKARGQVPRPNSRV